MRNLVRRALATTLTGLVVAMTALVAISAPSSASLLNGAITSVTVSPATPAIGDLITTTVDWKVPDGTKAGDTFSLTLPSQLTNFPDGTFVLKDPTGAVVANALIANGKVTFTMTSYAETHNDVAGSATFTAHLDPNQVTPGQPTELVYTTNDSMVFRGTVTTPAVIDGRFDSTHPGKYGELIDNNRIQWTMWTQAGPLPSTTITDQISPTMQLDCTTPIDILIGTPTGPNGNFAAGVPGNPTGDYNAAAHVTCDASTNKLTVVTGALPAGHMVRFSFDTTITSTTATSFSNQAVFSSSAGTTTASSNTLTTTSATGDGNGNKPVPGIHIVKGDVNGNAADTPETAATLPTGATGLVLAITNTGGEPLQAIDVTDTLDTANGSVSGLTCDFSKLGGPTTGTTWNGPFSVGASFTCTAALSGVTAGSTLHEDTAKVTALGTVSGDPIFCDNPYYATAPGSVSVGDFVWLDTNGNGIQDAGEAGIGGVRLTLTGPTGGAVTDVTGATVGATTTASDGSYTFANLPILPAGQHYTVTIDMSSPALAGLLPTTAGVGTDRAVDSSTGSATSGDLTANGDRDPTLDFGFVTVSKGNPSIRVEKYDGNTTFTPNGAVSTANKNTDAPGGDADTAASAIVSGSTSATPVSITFNNNGDVLLYDVTVIDQTVDGTGTVSNLSCTFPDGSKGLYFAGPLTIGAVVNCTGILPALGAAAHHEDRVTVYGRPGTITGGRLGPDAQNPPTGKPIKAGDAGTITDNDLFFVTTPVDPTTTTVPTVVEAATVTTSAAKPLAFTGGDVAPLLGLAAGLLAAGLLLVRRRRRD